jgi:hypothetical protein
MSRRGAVTLILLLVGGIATAAGVIFYRSHYGSSSPPKPIQTSQSTPLPGGPTPLPDSFESPGLVSRRAEPLRLYVAVAREIPLSKQNSADPQSSGQTLTSVPIVVVLENDTYKKVNFDSELAPAGEDLFTLAVRRVGPNAEEVFTYREPRAELSGWQPAERKTFTVSWPAAQLTPGDYVVSVTPAFGKQEKVQIHTTLR